MTKECEEKKYSLLLSQESQVTQSFFARIGSWVKVLNAGGVLVVDEIEASMHQLLTRHIIEAMQDKEVNTKQKQLIFKFQLLGEYAVLVVTNFANYSVKL